MKAIAKTERVPGAVKIIDAPMPNVPYGYVLIKVQAAAICGSDLHVLESPPGYEFMKIPCILGHEYSGIVESVGEGVSQFKVGDLVMAESNQFCGRCSNCHKGLTNICENNKMTGIHVDGGMAEFIAVPEVIVHRLPEGVSFSEAAVGQPCSISFHAVFDNSDIVPADDVVVFGPGIVGLLAAQAAKMMGAKRIAVVGTEADLKNRLSKAKEMGFFPIVIDNNDLVKQIEFYFGSSHVDVVVECSGGISAVTQGLNIIRKGGSVTLVGIYSKSVEIPLTNLIRNEIRIHTSYTGTWKNYEQALLSIKSRNLDLKPLISNYLFDDGLQAFQDQIDKKILKAVLTFQ